MDKLMDSPAPPVVKLILTNPHYKDLGKALSLSLPSWLSVRRGAQASRPAPLSPWARGPLCPRGRPDG
eukprot:765751-Pyramimonas_sp.AAC.1